MVMTDRLPAHLRFRYAWEEFVEEALTEMSITMERTLYAGYDPIRLRQWWTGEGESDMRQALWLVLERRLGN